MASEFLQNFSKIKYFELKHPKELVQGCFWEESENKRKKEMNDQLNEMYRKFGKNRRKHKSVYKQAYENFSYVEKEKMKQYMWDALDDRTRLIFEKENEKSQYQNEEYDKIINEYYIEIDAVMKQYIEIRKLSYSQVENAYGQIDFFKANKNIRNSFIYEHIHKKQRDIFHFIIEEAWHFEQYYTFKNGNVPVMISKILDIQDKLFSRKETELGFTIYNDFWYRVDTELYELLKLIYGKNYKGLIPDKKIYAVFSRITGNNVCQNVENISSEE